MREDRNAWREQARKVAAALRWRPRPLSLVGHGGGGWRAKLRRALTLQLGQLGLHLCDAALGDRQPIAFPGLLKGVNGAAHRCERLFQQRGVILSLRNCGQRIR